MVQKYGAELAQELPEVDHFIGLDELEKAPAAALGLPTLARFTDKPQAVGDFHCINGRAVDAGFPERFGRTGVEGGSEFVVGDFG
jgi:hypothetical protein